MPNYERPVVDAETRERLQKPMRGTAKLARMDRKAKADAREDRNKTKVRKRDGHCRWPHFAEEARELCRRTVTEVAHLTHKGMGGDIQTIRSKSELMIRVCCHQGVGSFHSGDRRVQFLTPQKANGPLAFLERRGRERWVEIARELWPGVLAPRKDAR